MIQNKKDYYYYLEQDRIQLGRKRKKPKINDHIWKFERLLRKCEYYNNCRKDFLGKIILLVLKYKKSKVSIKYNFSIPLNVFDSGLSIAHIGPIIVNENAKIGKNCRIHVCTNIGTSAGYSDMAPTIGDNVYIAPGVKIFGKITIGNRIAIGANAVVNKNFEEDDITIAGVPAKIVSKNGTKSIIK